MATTVVYRGEKRIMEKKMETTSLNPKPKELELFNEEPDQGKVRFVQAGRGQVFGPNTD